MRPYFILLEFAAIQTSHHTYLTEETAAFPVIVISLLLIMLLLREWIWKGNAPLDEDQSKDILNSVLKEELSDSDS